MQQHIKSEASMAQQPKTADFTGLKFLAVKAAQDRFRADVDNTRGLQVNIQSNNQMSLSAVSNVNAVGSVYSSLRSLPGTSMVISEELIVSPILRGQGWSEAIFTAQKFLLHALYVSKMVAFVMSDNAVQQSRLTKLGWRKTGKVDGFYSTEAEGDELGGTDQRWYDLWVYDLNGEGGLS